MRVRFILLVILLAFLLLSTGVGALAAPRYQVETGTISGGGYQLTTFGSQAGNVAAGGAYRLLGPTAPELQGSGCCCVYLPCVLRRR
jgi:hypothetical protein